MNNLLAFQVHGSAGHKSGSGIVGNIEQFLHFIEGLVRLSWQEMFTTVFPGISGMVNIHPLVVHFPIAFLLAFFLADLFGTLFRQECLRKFAGGLLYLGTIFAGAAVAAGLIAEESVAHGENVHLILEKHETLGISVLTISVILSIWRLLSKGEVKRIMNVIYLFFAMILSLLILLTADYGGMMVYKHGVAVEAVEGSMMDYFQEHTHSH